MCAPICMISLLLALLVLLGGLFLLAYAKKEGLGKMTKIASYVAILFSSVVFIGGIICCCMMCGKCNDGNSCGKGSMKCTKEVRIMGDHKEMMEMHHGMMNATHCEKNATEHCCKVMKSECKKGKCDKTDEKCCKGEAMNKKDSLK